MQCGRGKGEDGGKEERSKGREAWDRGGGRRLRERGSVGLGVGAGKIGE